MTLEEAIKHAEEKSRMLGCSKCAEEHKQLAEWLKELKCYRECGKITFSLKNQAVIKVSKDIWDKVMEEFDKMSDEEFLEFVKDCEENSEFEFAIIDNKLIGFRKEDYTMQKIKFRGGNQWSLIC